MPTLWTKTLIPTLRQDPAEAEVPSHRLMLRAGLIRQLSAGVYTYLPIGWRSMHKAIEIVRQEMDAAGAVEMFMPALEPIELMAEPRAGDRPLLLRRCTRVRQRKLVLVRIAWARGRLPRLRLEGPARLPITQL